MKSIEIISPKDIHLLAVEKGWWNDCVVNSNGDISKEEVLQKLPEKVALMHSELSEALEAYRNFKDYESDDIIEEFADVIIRIFDFCGALGWDVIKAIQLKHEKNKKRPYRHGGKRC